LNFITTSYLISPRGISKKNLLNIAIEPLNVNKEDGSKRILAVNENRFNPGTWGTSVYYSDSTWILRNIKFQFFNSIAKSGSIRFTAEG
jgi:hypothetical protein